MRILLVGEYSRLHNSLKEGLQALGHQVVLVGNGDHFKKFPVDISIDSSFLKKYFPSIKRKIIFKFFKIDVFDYEVIYKFNKYLPQLKDFDVIQFINEDALNIHPKFQINLLKRLLEQNGKLFLLSCGDDYVNISHYLKDKEKYSILSPLMENESLKKKYQFSLKYLTKPYLALHNFIKNRCSGVITTDIDYHLPYLEKENYLGLIPNPINIDKIKYQPLVIDDKIIIFHGINTLSSVRKGNEYFSQALEIIKDKYDHKVEIRTSFNIPYNQYLSLYEDCHIFLDQVYSYDQGYNALEAMARGKVVFTGAEKEWLDFYNLKENSVAINALPNVHDIVEKLEWLILHPEKIIEISKNARKFIEKEHDYITISKCYLDIWCNN